jgi:hypothetical protein
MSESSDDAAKSEYVCLVDWLNTVARTDAKWRSASQLYTTPLIRASLDGQPATLKFIEEHFDLRIRDIII